MSLELYTNRPHLKKVNGQWECETPQVFSCGSDVRTAFQNWLTRLRLEIACNLRSINKIGLETYG